MKKKLKSFEIDQYEILSLHLLDFDNLSGREQEQIKQGTIWVLFLISRQEFLSFWSPGHL